MLRSEMRALLRDLIDDSRDNVWPDDRLNRLLYHAARHLQSIIEDIDVGYFVETEDISVNANDTAYALSNLSEPYRNIMDLYSVNGPELIKWKYVDYRTGYVYDDSITDRQNDNVYSIRKESIIFPIPLSQSLTIRISYTKQIVDLANDSSTWTEFPERTHDLIVYKAALMALASEDSKAEDLRREFAEMQARLINSLERRDRSQPRRVRVTY